MLVFENLGKMRMHTLLFLLNCTCVFYWDLTMVSELKILSPEEMEAITIARVKKSKF